MDPVPFVTVIIPVWNGADQIGRCLAAIGAQTYPKDRFEVLVVDNASTDATPAVIRGFPFVTPLYESKPGSYHARNLGLTHAKGAFIAFTDADCTPDPDWLTNGIAAALRNPKAGVLAGHIALFLEGAGDSKACEQFEKLFAFRQDTAAQRGFCATANWLSPRPAIDQAGGFRADRKSGADGELAHAIKSGGWQVVYVPDMVVSHPVRATFKDLAKKRRRLTGGRWARTAGPIRSARIVGFIMRDTMRRLKVTALESGLGLRIRVEVAALVLALAGVAIGETIKLMVSGNASRA